MKEYTVTINGVDHTLLLSEEDAQTYKDRGVEVKAAAPQNKSRNTSTK